MSLQEVIIAVQNGLKFSEMTEFDRQAFAGAEPGSLLASSDIAVYILNDNELSVITEDYEKRYSLGLEFTIEM